MITTHLYIYVVKIMYWNCFFQGVPRQLLCSLLWYSFFFNPSSKLHHLSKMKAKLSCENIYIFYISVVYNLSCHVSLNSIKIVTLFLLSILVSLVSLFILTVVFILDSTCTIFPIFCSLVRFFGGGHYEMASHLNYLKCKHIHYN